MVGYYDFMPDRQFKSEGYRLEELVRSSLGLSAIKPLIMRLMQGPSHKENSTSRRQYYLTSISDFCGPVAHEEIMRNAAKLQGCPVIGPWSLDGRR